MTTTSYAQKLLRVTLILPEGNFPGTSSNTLTLVGYKTSATVQGAARYPNTLDLELFGMKADDMNAVTILYSASTPTAVATRALVILEASPDGGATFTQVFEGTFVQAQPDYQDLPNGYLHVQAITGNGMQITTVPPTSYTGATSIAQIAQYLAQQMGFSLENNGVTGNLASPYFPGTYMDQFRQLCEHANLDFYFDGNTTLAICPANQPRQGKPKPVLSPSTGLVGFPVIGQYGIQVKALWTPALTLGGEIEVAGSIVPPTNGTWSPYNVTHRLESWVEEGEWFTTMDCRPS